MTLYTSPPPYQPTTHTQCQKHLCCYWPDFDGTLKVGSWRTSRTDSNCDICPGNICNGNISPYQQYLSCYWPEFDLTNGPNYFGVLIFVDQQFFWPNIFCSRYFLEEIFFLPDCLDPKFFWLQPFFDQKFWPTFFWTKIFWQNSFNPNHAGGGANGPQQIQIIISLRPNVRLTSNKAVFSSLSFVLRSINKKISIWTLEGPWKAFDRQGSPNISLAGSILRAIWGSMKVPEVSLSLGEVQQWP